MSLIRNVVAKLFTGNETFGSGGFWKNLASSISGKYLGTHLTGAEREANEWTAQREDTFHQRTVADMQAAGLNTALMYGNGASGASPSASVSPGSADPMSLIQLVMLPEQLKQMKAQTQQILADAADKRAGAKLKGSETQYRDSMTRFQNLINKDFPEKNRAEIDNILESTNSLKTKQDVDRAEVAYKNAETVLRNLEKDNFSEFRAAQIALLKAQRKEALSQADYNAVRKMFEKVQYEYAHDNKMLMASSEGFGIAMAIASVFGLNLEKIKKAVREGNEWITENMTPEEIVDVFGGD